MATVTKRTKGRRKHGAPCPYCGKRHGDGAPWFNRSKNGWSLSFKVNGKTRNRLLTKGWETHDEAIELWKAQPSDASPFDNTNGESTTVETLCELYLEHLKNNAAERTYQNARQYLNDFCFGVNGMGRLTVADMRKGGIARIKAWANAHSWSDTTKEGVYKRIKSVFNYAAADRENEDSLGIIQSSPIAKLNTGKRRIKGKPREAIFSAEQVDAILANANPRGTMPQAEQAFRVLLATGVRPDEFCSVTADDVFTDGDGEAYWFIAHKNIKNTGKKRRVYLTAEMQRITLEQKEKNPSGSLFRNTWGGAWTVAGLEQALRRITEREECKRLGLDKSEVSTLTSGKQKRQFVYVPYTFRHTFAHRWLTGFYKTADGQPIILNYGEVAQFMGNTAAEVERTYGKLSNATAHLSSRLKSVGV